MEIPSFVGGKSEVKRSRLDPKTEADRIRASRKSFNGLEMKLSFLGEHPGWKRRWVNDENVPQRLNQGYRFVEPVEVELSDSLRYGNSDVGNRVAYPTGGLNTRNETAMAFLMEIPQEIADELDGVVKDKTAAIDQTIRAGKIGNPGKESYVPRDTPIRYNP